MIGQLVIATFGVTSVWLANDPKYYKYASVFGLIAQPAWFYETYKAGQYGIFCLTFIYTISWGRGFYNHWIKRS